MYPKPRTSGASTRNVRDRSGIVPRQFAHAETPGPDPWHEEDDGTLAGVVVVGADAVDIDSASDLRIGAHRLRATRSGHSSSRLLAIPGHYEKIRS